MTNTNKRKFKIYKRRFAAVVASAGILASMGAYTFQLTHGPKKSNDSTDNTIGYVSINPWFNYNVKENNFVILDVGDHNSVGVHFQNQKIKYCNDNNISLGIIISTNSYTENDIYNDIEYVKGLIQNSNVDFPVYLDIDNIITNNSLNVEMKTKLIKDFLEKCSSNGISVSVYGTDTNLCRMKRYCSITDYDSFLVMDSEAIKYDGKFSICKRLDGTVESKSNLSENIIQKGLNEENKFVTDGAYVMDSNESILDVAMQYGLSVAELLKFNNIKETEIAPGTILRIPTVVNRVAPTLSVNYKKLTEPLRGIDVSYAQGTKTEWDKVASSFDYVIVKCCQGLSLDSCFEGNVLQCVKNNIPIGVYCYNQYDVDNCENTNAFCKAQESQTDFLLTNLKNKKIDYPVFFDIEFNGNEDIREKLPKEYVQKMLSNWKNKLENSGYIPGIYSNKSTYQYLMSCVDYDLSEDFEIWIAGGNQYTGETRDIDINDVKPQNNNYIYNNNSYNCDMVQVTDSAVNSGVGNSKGHVDVNYTYTDYSNKDYVYAKDNNEYGFETKEFDRVDIPLVSAGVLSGLGLIGITVLKIKRAKDKKESRRNR